MATEEVVQKFSGKWKETKHENIGDFMKEMGVNIVARKVAGTAHPELEMTFEGDTLTVKMKIAIKSQTMVFVVGGESEVDNDQGKFKTTTTYEDGKLTSHLQPMEGNKGKPSTIIREMTEDGQLLFTLKVGEVEAKRWFSKVTK